MNIFFEIMVMIVIAFTITIPFIGILCWIDRKSSVYYFEDEEDNEKSWLEKTQENLGDDLNDKKDSK